MRPAPTASPRRAALLLGLLIALTVIGSSAVAVALPVVQRDLGLDTSGTAWVFACFSLTFSITTATYGRVADLVGLRRPLQVGVVLMAIGSVVVGLAPSFPALVAGRLLQGAGAGAVPVLANGIVTARFEGAARTATFGGLISVVAIVSGSGPLIGGAVEALLGWRWVFALPALGVVLIRPISALAPAQGEGGRLDLRGAALTAGLAGGALLVLQAPSAGRTVGLAGAGLVAVTLPSLVRHTGRRPAGFLPRAVLTNPVVVRASLAGLTLLASYFAVLFAVPVLLAERQGWAPLQIGLALLPAAVFGAATSLVAGRVTPRLGPWRSATAAGLLAAGGIAAAALLPGLPAGGMLGLAGVSGGFGLGQVALLDAVSEAAAPAVRGVTLGVYNLVFFLGAGAGSAAIGGLSGVLGVPVALLCLLPVPLAGAALAASGRRRLVPAP